MVASWETVPPTRCGKTPRYSRRISGGAAAFPRRPERLMAFFVETLFGGLLAGVMYSLVAIGFVLIYKASGVFNFAQGAMLLFAALTFVSLVERGLPFVAALVVTLAAMVLVAI